MNPEPSPRTTPSEGRARRAREGVQTVSAFMTHSPVTIGRDEPLTVAHQLMERHGVHHLPVLAGARPVGLLCARDLRRLEQLPGGAGTDLTVEQVMLPAPLLVAVEAPLPEVATAMADSRHEAALVMAQEHVVGIFTTADALHALATVLEGWLGDTDLPRPSP